MNNNRMNNNRKRRLKKKLKNITPINIYLPSDLVLKIKSKAKEQGLTMAGYIRMLLINNHKDCNNQS